MTTQTAPAREGAGAPARNRLRALVDTPEVGVVVACAAVFLALALARDTFASAVTLQGMGFDLAQSGLGVAPFNCRLRRFQGVALPPRFRSNPPREFTSRPILCPDDPASADHPPSAALDN